MATRITCERLTAWHLKALYDSVEQACCLPERGVAIEGWHLSTAGQLREPSGEPSSADIGPRGAWYSVRFPLTTRYLATVSHVGRKGESPSHRSGLQTFRDQHKSNTNLVVEEDQHTCNTDNTALPGTPRHDDVKGKLHRVPLPACQLSCMRAEYDAVLGPDASWRPWSAPRAGAVGQVVALADNSLRYGQSRCGCACR
jgi:hypothetical protein